MLLSQQTPTPNIDQDAILVSKEGSLAAAVTAAGAAVKTIHVNADTTVVADLTAPANVVLKPYPGSIITLAPLKTLTLECEIEAGQWQIFSVPAGANTNLSGPRFVSPVWWGASPSASAATNTAAFQRALDVGGLVLVPSGTYQLNELTMSVANTLLRGEGWSTVLEYQGSGTFITLNAGVFCGCRFDDLEIQGTAGSSELGVQLGSEVPTRIIVANAGGVTLKNVSFRNFTVIDGAAIGGSFVYGCKIESCTFRACYTCIWFGETSINNTVTDCWMRDWSAYGVRVSGTVLWPSFSNHVLKCVIDEAAGGVGTGTAIYFEENNASEIMGNHFENLSTAILITQGLNNRVISNLFASGLTTALNLTLLAGNTMVSGNRYITGAIIDTGNRTTFFNDTPYAVVGDGGYLNRRVAAGMSTAAEGFFAVTAGSGIELFTRDLRAYGTRISGAASSNGQYYDIQSKSTELTALAGASATWSNAIPAGSEVLGVSCLLTEAIGNSNGTSGFRIGDGTDVDRWADKAAIAVDTITDFTDFVDLGRHIYQAATDIVVTAVGGNFDGIGAIRLVLHYVQLVPPTS